MAIQKPYSLSIKDQVIDGKKDYTLKWLTSGDTSASFSISIYNNQTNTLVWSLSRTYSFAMSYTIPANSFPNGVDYKISVTVWNSSGQSATSNFVVFTASSTPVVTIDPISVNNHSYLFSANYSQTESDLISSYTVNLYDDNQNLLKTSGKLGDGLLEYRFDLLKNNLTYSVEFIVTSKKGLTASSGLIPFTVNYDNPNMYFNISAETLSDKPSVKLNWAVSQITGKTNVSPIYVNGTELDVRLGKVFFDEGFSIDKDFTLKIWLRNITQDKELIYLNGLNGYISLVYKSDQCFHLYKKANDYLNHYSTAQKTGTSFFICIQSINGKMDMNIQVIN